MAERPLRIAVSGYYGFGNTGDEAVLAGIAESFRERAPDVPVEITVLSTDPADTERRHGLRAVPRMSRTALAEVFRSSDLVVSGGGSLLQDTTSLRSVVYYLWVVRLAQKCGAPVMFYAQGIGPLRRQAARTLTRMVANRVERITVRDPESAEILRGIGVRKPPIAVTADPAFALHAAPNDSVDRILAEAGVAAGEKLIGVSLRPWRTSTAPQRFAEMARRTADATGRRLLFLPMQPPGDTELARAVAREMGDEALIVDRPLSPAEAIGVVSRLELLIGMRLHALIFGAASAVPILGLAYDPKVTQLMTMAGQSERQLTLEDAQPEVVAEQAREAVMRSGEIRTALRERASILREKALENVDHALLAIQNRI